MRANMRAGGVIDAVVTSSLLESVRSWDIEDSLLACLGCSEL